MTRSELIQGERARQRDYSYVYYIFALAVVGGIIAVPSLEDLSPLLGTLTGNSWLVPLIVGLYLINLWHQSRAPRCPQCRRALNGAIAVATDRCSRCGRVAVDDPLSQTAAHSGAGGS